MGTLCHQRSHLHDRHLKERHSHARMFTERRSHTFPPHYATVEYITFTFTYTSSQMSNHLHLSCGRHVVYKILCANDHLLSLLWQ